MKNKKITKGIIGLLFGGACGFALAYAQSCAGGG
jgi:hypothetical protein